MRGMDGYVDGKKECLCNRLRDSESNEGCTEFFVLFLQRFSKSEIIFDKNFRCKNKRVIAI